MGWEEICFPSNLGQKAVQIVELTELEVLLPQKTYVLSFFENNIN